MAAELPSTAAILLAAQDNCKPEATTGSCAKGHWIHHGDKEAPLPEEVSALSHIGNMDETLLRCDIPGDLVRLQSLTLARDLFQPHYRP